MKKSFQLEIKSPCDADIKEMDKNKNGFFCHLCTKDVIDLSNKSDYEISKFISENKNQSICARLNNTQLERDFDLLEKTKSNNFKYAFAVAASVLLTSNVVAQENQKPQTEIKDTVKSPEIMGKIAYHQVENKTVSFTLKGRILDKKTLKPISKSGFENVSVSLNSFEITEKVNHRKGTFSVPITLNNNTNEVTLTFESDGKIYSKKVLLLIDKIENDILIQDFLVDTDDFETIRGTIGAFIINEE